MLAYILLSNLSLCLLYAVYWAFLRQETFFRLNRYYLLLAVVVALLIPFANIPILVENEAIGGKLLTLVPEFSTPPSTVEADAQAQTVKGEASAKAMPTEIQVPYFQWFMSNWQEVLLCVYLIGALIFTFQFLKGLKGIYALIRKNQKIKQGNYYLVQYEGNKGVFSFFHYLFWSKQISDNEAIKRHELAHINQRHSIDILFFELLGIAFWCNPVIRLYQKSIRLVHEYLADEAVTQKIVSKTNYAHTLVAHATQGIQFQLTHHFYHHQTLKKRIMKIYQEESKPKAIRKYLLALPVVMLCLFVSAYEKQDLKSIDSKNKGKNPIANESDSAVYAEGNVFASPNDSTNFYKEMLELVSLPEDMKSPDPKELTGDWVLEVLVNQEGSIVKSEFVERIQTTQFDKEKGFVWAAIQRPHTEINSALYKAFMKQSEGKNWLGNSGKRLATKIRFKISAKVVFGELFGC